MLADQFAIVLSSNASLDLHPNNRLNCSTTELSYKLNLNGEYQVALERISFPRNWYNVTRNNSFYVGHWRNGEWSGGFKSIAPGYYKSCRELGDAVIKEIGPNNDVMKFLYNKIENKMHFQPQPEALFSEVTPEVDVRISDILGIPNDIRLFKGNYKFVRWDGSTVNPDQRFSLFTYLQADVNLGCSHLIVLLDIVTDLVFSSRFLPLADVVPIT